ncbi:MAG: energy transducer TonB [Saprospiraceae bacterium]
MKRFLTSSSLLLLATLVSVNLAFTDVLRVPPPVEVNRMKPFVSITKDSLAFAKTLLDINPRYDADWVKTYKSVEITTTADGQVKKVVAETSTLSSAQKAQLASADLGAEIHVLVRYIPENDLSQNDLQEMYFSFTVEADRDAQYPGGQAQILDYFNKTAVNQIPDGAFGEWGMSAVTFAVDAKGYIGEVEAVEPLQDSAIAALLVEAVCNMPRWEPARYDNGTAVEQRFALTVGNMRNCKIPLLNIREEESVD